MSNHSVELEIDFRGNWRVEEQGHTARSYYRGVESVHTSFRSALFILTIIAK